jgi:hypothetical protein
MRLPGPIVSAAQRRVDSGGLSRSGSFIGRPAQAAAVRRAPPPGAAIRGLAGRRVEGDLAASAVRGRSARFPDAARRLAAVVRTVAREQWGEASPPDTPPVAAWFALDPQSVTHHRGSDSEAAVVGAKDAKHGGMLGASLPRSSLGSAPDEDRLALALGDHQAVAVRVADPDLALGTGASVSDGTDPQPVRDQVVAQPV